MGLNTTTIQGRRVMLVTDFNQSLTGLPLTMTEAHTTYDDSTSAPLPPGGPAPPLPPELPDQVPPVVTAIALRAGVLDRERTPPTVPITFTLTGGFPTGGP